MRKGKKHRAMGNNVLYVGVDVHGIESHLAVLEQDGSLVEERRLPTRELGGFLSSLPGEKRVAIEATGFVYPVYDRLSSLEGCVVTVANPNRLKLISGSSTKNDRNDARALGDLLRTDYLPVAHLRDLETREKLSVVNDRVTYGSRRGELKGTIKWLLKRRGIEVDSPFSDDGLRKLRELHLQEIDLRLDELAMVESVVKRLDSQIEAIASKDPKAALLDSLPGVAPYTALFLTCVLDDVERFPDSKHACAYLGLVPWLDESADTTRLGHITKKGDKWLRRNLVECARVAVRKDPHLGEFYARLKHRRGERKALIAVARKLVSYAYWMLKRNTTYEGLSPWNLTWGDDPRGSE
jgi:transposase